MIGSSDTQYTCNFVVNPAFSNLLLDFSCSNDVFKCQSKKKDKGTQIMTAVSTDYDYCMA